MTRRRSVDITLCERISSRCNFVILQNSCDSNYGICHWSGKMLNVAFGPDVASFRILLNQANLRFVFSRVESGLPGANGSS